jgi:hypothetical protein
VFKTYLDLEPRDEKGKLTNKYSTVIVGNKFAEPAKELCRYFHIDYVRMVGHIWEFRFTGIRPEKK